MAGSSVSPTRISPSKESQIRPNPESQIARKPDLHPAFLQNRLLAQRQITATDQSLPNSSRATFYDEFWRNSGRQSDDEIFEQVARTLRARVRLRSSIHLQWRQKVVAARPRQRGKISQIVRRLSPGQNTLAQTDARTHLTPVVCRLPQPEHGYRRSDAHCLSCRLRRRRYHGSSMISAVSGVSGKEKPCAPTMITGLPNAIPRSADPPIPTTISAAAYAGRGSRSSPVRMTAARPNSTLVSAASRSSSFLASPSPTINNRRGRSCPNTRTESIVRRRLSLFNSHIEPGHRHQHHIVGPNAVLLPKRPWIHNTRRIEMHINGGY